MVTPDPVDEQARWRRVAAEVLEIEAAAIRAVRVDESFYAAVRRLSTISGKVVCMGVGKSGHIAGKIAATLASTGTSAFFMNPAEAGHGDLGALAAGDAVLAISYSGESEEMVCLIPALKRLRIPIVAIVGVLQSTLATAADFLLHTPVDREACPHNLAPTASTTAALALGDALAMTLLVARGFSPDDFARTHPAGRLGRRLLLRVGDIMRTGDDIPCVRHDATFAEMLIEITGKRMGMTLVTDNRGALAGIFTDGDLRRAYQGKEGNPEGKRAGEMMTAKPQTIADDALAVEALKRMEERAVNQLAVLDGKGALVGAIAIHDLLAHHIL